MLTPEDRTNLIIRARAAQLSPPAMVTGSLYRRIQQLADLLVEVTNELEEVSAAAAPKTEKGGGAWI